MHATRQQPLAKIEALGQRHMQSGIQYKVITVALHGFIANSGQQPLSQASALKVGTHH